MDTTHTPEQQMRVYTAMEHIDYEGSTLLGVYGSREEAENCCRKQKGFREWAGYSYGVVESQLGQIVDFHSDVDWLE